MDSSVSGSNRIDIFEIYRRYCDITSENGWVCREEGCRPDDKLQGVKYSSGALAQLLKLVELRAQTSDRSLIFDDLSELMSRLNLMVDPRESEFACFYQFVFFMCRENGQRNITVSRALVAWRLVLAGRFRLLNQWCDFVEKNQRHNISEDTWRQVLAFSRCVHEDLKGYDPTGAWPVLIDDFAEHMYRITPSNSFSPRSFDYSCSDPEAQLCIFDNPLPGLNLSSGSKRKLLVDFGGDEVVSPNSPFPDSASPTKRNRQTSLASKPATWDDNPPGNTTADCMEIVKHNSPPATWEDNPPGNTKVDCMEIVKNNNLVGSMNDSPCAFKGSLSKGFAGLESTGSCLQFEQKKRVYYT